MIRVFFMLTLAIFLPLLSAFGTGQNNPRNLTNETQTIPTCNKCCETVPHIGCCKDGKDGKDGQNGKDGRDGMNGRDGRDGTNGVKGDEGSPGDKGSPGQKGEPGQKGMPGTCGSKGSSLGKSACCLAKCSSGFHFFEKIQDLPSRGALDVEHFTIDGKLFLAFANYHGDLKQRKTASVIYKMDETTGNFTLYQTLQSRGAYDIEYFSIAGKHFLAVANHYDGTHQLDSVIHQWNGTLFVVFQKLTTKGGSHFAFFVINGEKYLAVANFYDGASKSIKSFIYKWSNGKFNKFQEVATEGALGCTAFVINNNSFIAFANYNNRQQGFSVESTVFKWSGGRFVKLQSLQAYGAQDVKSFDINGHSFLAFATYYRNSYTTDSFIYKWDGNMFVLFQSIPTRGGMAWHSFVISGQTYLGVANHRDSSQKLNTQSVVYQASGARFIKYQEISTYGASGMTSFEYKGHMYLAVANHYNSQSGKYNIDSALYKWV